MNAKSGRLDIVDGFVDAASSNAIVTTRCALVVFGGNATGSLRFRQ